MTNYCKEKDFYSIHVERNDASSKVSDKWEIYLREYGRLFSPYRDREINFLEIGVQNGGSLEVLSKYFTKAAKIIGCDIDDKCSNLIYDDERISVVIGDASSTETVSKILQQAPSLDIVVDDGSHQSGHIIKSFCYFFPMLERGGIYIAEDLHCSYWQEFEGGIYNYFSSMSFFKALTDYINREHFGLRQSPKEVLYEFFEHYGCDMAEVDLSQIHSIEFINSLCIIRKSNSVKNILGANIISGTDAIVVPGAYKYNGRRLYPPSQDGSEYNVSYNQQIKELKVVVAEREAQLSHQCAQVAEKEAQLSHQCAQVAEKEAQLSHQCAQATEKEAQINQLNDLIVYKEAQLSHKDGVIIGKDMLLLSIYSSFLWKIIKPLRVFSQFTKSVFSYTKCFLVKPFVAINNYIKISNVPQLGQLKLITMLKFVFLQGVGNFFAKLFSPITKYKNKRKLNINYAKNQIDKSVAVIYLVRGASKEELVAIDKFITSYDRNKAGYSHNLYMVFKGFDDDVAIKNIKEKIPFNYKAFYLDDDGYDIGAYIRVSKQLNEDALVFFNTYSEIRASNWLYKIVKPMLYDNDVGLVGTSSSFESLAIISDSFPVAPNAHIRTNAFAISRERFVQISKNIIISTKIDACLFESGIESMTRKICQLNKLAVVVDVNGDYFFEKEWHVSGVFRNLFSSKHLISDNRIVAFKNAKWKERVIYAYSAWRVRK